MVDLNLTPAPSKEELYKQAENDNKYIQYRAKSLLATLDEKGEIPTKYPYPLQVWRLGDDFMIIAMGGEVVVDYSLLFKHQFGEENTWVIGYANDVCAYIPSLRVLREGGYEGEGAMVYYNFHGPWAEDVEDIIVQEVHQLAEAKARGEK